MGALDPRTTTNLWTLLSMITLHAQPETRALHFYFPKPLTFGQNIRHITAKKSWGPPGHQSQKITRGPFLNFRGLRASGFTLVSKPDHCVTVCFDSNPESLAAETKEIHVTGVCMVHGLPSIWKMYSCHYHMW